VQGLGAACKVAGEEMEADRAHVEMLSKRLIDGLSAQCANIQLNGDADARYPGNVNMSFAYVEGESLLMGRVGTFHVILQSKHQLMTSSSIVHVTNLTPGSDNPTHGPEGDRGEQRQRVHLGVTRALVRAARAGRVALTPGCQIGYLDYTGCHLLNSVSVFTAK
jgi:hypothetical protein